MPKHEIEIEISRTGEVKAHIKGAKGKACLTYAKLLAQIVGQAKSEQLTSEYYEPDDKVRIDVQQKQGR